jgi:hypothetical protein
MSQITQNVALPTKIIEYAGDCTVKTGVSFGTYYGIETVPRQVSFQHLKVSFKCENDTPFILSSVGNDTFEGLN